MPIIPLVAAGVGLAGSAITARGQSRAADKSARASQYATDESIRYQREQDARTYGDTQGARDLGNAATGRLKSLIDGTMPVRDWLESTPGYQIGLDQGQRQINASAAAKGGLMSGAAAREGLRFGQDYATGVLNNERNALFTSAGIGAQGVGTGAQSGAQAANASQNALTGNASNLASSYGQKADATAGMWGTMAGSFGGNPFANRGGSFMSGFTGGGGSNGLGRSSWRGSSQPNSAFKW